ncbi:LIM domain transcription factor LMO4.1-like isoform X2 [Gigantopelta aegis]|uniref:LIM domain transcription factor LMO4.1-like isoform X2 n=1 Tax=Gigantopelta aegis TaxID=1735272 RepID=UPI001B889645|nr:LIM domain transcription factor LMO4.1-like isoform X2 [Gigantopelta aegis]
MDTTLSPFNSLGSGGPDASMGMNSSLVSQTTNSSGGSNGSAGGPGSVKACAGCGARILDRFLLHALDRYWHTGCLKCSCCQAQLGEIGTSCFTKAGMILCRNDYIRLFGSGGTCAACSQTIPANELVMRVQASVYHLKCFTCVSCHGPLQPGDRFGIINGSLVCEQDYPKVLKGHNSLPPRATHKVS